MPGKVNPVMPEATLMACAQVIGNDVDDHDGRRRGQLRAQRHAAGHGQERPRVDPAARERRAGCSPTGASTASTADVEHARELAEGSPSIVTPLNRYIGYEAAAAVVKQADQGAPDDPRGRHRPTATSRSGELTEEQLDEALDVLAMTRPPAG